MDLDGIHKKYMDYGLSMDMHIFSYSAKRFFFHFCAGYLGQMIKKLYLSTDIHGYPQSTLFYPSSMDKHPDASMVVPIHDLDKIFSNLLQGLLVLRCRVLEQDH
jgi:hypothetical protein